MSGVGTKSDGVRQLILTVEGRNSLFLFSPREWEELKKFFGIDLLRRINDRVNGNFGTPPFRFPEYDELQKFVNRWFTEPEAIEDRD